MRMAVCGACCCCCGLGRLRLRARRPHLRRHVLCRRWCWGGAAAPTLSCAGCVAVNYVWLPVCLLVRLGSGVWQCLRPCQLLTECGTAACVLACVRQPFTRFVEIGRVALINYGPEEGKLCTIIDVVDQNRALVDGPYGITGVHRQVINLRRLSLTDFKVKIGLNARAKSLKKAWAAAGVQEKWAATAWAAKRASRSAKASLTDLGRFKAMLAKKTVRC